ncbi:hypothetical protein Ea92_05A [Erwinia phage Ea9-2]|uniref:Uncharacterized protein n=1 Tax=Erwinia phage Ea9-2 TaxID=1429767 RepID=W6AR06_9CAUD|nr:hypothetical protein Ea92_05A [Erwinia phage Ea9-2]AHI60062.1 hypothetical protein Ea92_05A [Erwinia phage Ea9-2]
MRKNSYNYRVKRGAKGEWLVRNDKMSYRVSRGVMSGTWYVYTQHGSNVFNAGTLRDCIIWILIEEGLTDAI